MALASACPTNNLHAALTGFDLGLGMGCYECIKLGSMHFKPPVM